MDENKPRRRLHGLRLTALPTAATAVQAAGGLAALGGVYLQWGIAASLMVGGVAAAVLGMLREGGKL